MRYYFNLREGEAYVPDDEGLELPDLNAATKAAIHGLRSLIADDVLAGRLPLSTVMEVRDAQGGRVVDLPFRAAVAVEL